MIPSQYKSELGSRVSKYTIQCNRLRTQLDEAKDQVALCEKENTNESADLNFNESDDDLEQFLIPKESCNALEALDNQGKALTRGIRTGNRAADLARSAVVKLRGQKDKIINTIEGVADIGRELVRAD